MTVVDAAPIVAEFEREIEAIRQKIRDDFNEYIRTYKCEDAYCNRKQGFFGRLWMKWVCFNYGHYYCWTRQHCIHCGRKP